jgi:trimeric autotransporter adhesin
MHAKIYLRATLYLPKRPLLKKSVMKAFIHVLLFAVLFSTTGFAQSLAINTDGTTANASSLLEVKSTDKGVLIPRMSRAERNAIATPATGLLIFQNAPDSIGFYYYSGTTWLWLATANSNQGWLTTGNTGTNVSTNFLGTIDDVPLYFKVFSERSGRIDNTNRNTFFGFKTGKNLTSGTGNTLIGHTAGETMTIGNKNILIGTGAGYFANNFFEENVGVGDSALNGIAGRFNTAIGHYTLRNNIGNSNVALGQSAGNANTSGLANTFIGTGAGLRNTTASENVFVGQNTGLNNSTGTRNVFVGQGAGQLSDVGNNNVIIGHRAGWGSASSNYSVLIGDSAGFSHSTGNAVNGVVFIGSKSGWQSVSINNTFVGTQTGYNNVSGFRNTFIGTRAGFNNINSDDNTFIGYIAGNGNLSGANNAALGSSTLYSNALGFYNVAVGDSALYNTGAGAAVATEGAGNTGIGFRTLYTNTTGSNNTALGNNANVTAANLSNATAIGYRAAVGQSNSIVLGSINGTNGATADTRVGIGTTTPATSLDVSGTTKIGINGTTVNAVIRATFNLNLPSIAASGGTSTQTFLVPNSLTTATVYISPAAGLNSGVVIAYARVSVAGTVEVKFTNVTAAPIDPAVSDFYITVIQ